MQNDVNIQETDGGSVTVALPGPIRNLMEDTQCALIAIRVKHGAKSPIGHRCSNIVEMLKKRAPPAMIAKQMAELDRLLNEKAA